MYVLRGPNSETMSETRIWGSGASKGMTNTEDAIGIEIPGPHTKISTGAGVITAKKWYKERLPIGDMVHIGLEKTANTVSAGQANAEHGIATSWMEPAETPASKPGVCVLHKAGGSDGSLRFSRIRPHRAGRNSLSDSTFNCAEYSRDSRFAGVQADNRASMRDRGLQVFSSKAVVVACRALLPCGGAAGARGWRPCS